MKYYKNKKIFLFFILLFFFLFISDTFCSAQKPLEIDYPTIKGVKIATITVDLVEYVRYIFYLAISISGLLAFGALIFGGVKWLTSAGNPASMSDAKDQIFAGILGLVVLLGSWLFLNTINPQLVGYKVPDVSLIPTETLPSLKDGKICFYDKKCGDGDRQLLNCIDSGYVQKPAEGNIESVEVKEGSGSIAVAFFEQQLYDGRRICLKDTNDLCDLTKFSFSGNLFDNITDDINSVNIIPAEKCTLIGITLPAGLKDDFSAAVIAYKNRSYQSPAVEIFFAGDAGIRHAPKDAVKSIWIQEGSLAVRLYDKSNLGEEGGRYICFKDSISNLNDPSQAYYTFWNPLGWDKNIRSIEIINDEECEDPGKTKPVPKDGGGGGGSGAG